MPDKRRVLICANPDLNFIDGSSIWAQTIALVFADTGLATVDFLVKSLPQREELFKPLINHPRIHIINGLREKGITGMFSHRLSLPGMAEVAIDLEREQGYDLIIVRGYEIVQRLLSAPDVLSKCWIYLTDMAQNVEAYGKAERREVSRIAHGCAHLLCQTSGFRQLWMTLVPDLLQDKCTLYSPVIPDIDPELAPIASRPKLAVYAGKFTPDWMTLEMAETWPALHQTHRDAVLRMIGDKIHSEPMEFQQRMRYALEDTPGLEWMGALSREAVQAELRHARVGLSWRADSMNGTLEYSTKILEYGGAGCAAILNRNPLHEELLGEDYPLFANTEEQYIHALETALVDDQLTQVAANQLMAVAKEHTFTHRVQDVSQWLNKLPMKAEIRSRERQTKIHVLVAGHDLKFFTPLQKKLEETGKFQFLIDHWSGHDSHDESKSRELLAHADVIFCEWCLGNLKWYSKNRLPHQRLVARFHAQEREQPYVAKATWDNIDHISYVSEFIRREGQKAFGFPFEKTSVIPNLLDENKFTPKNKTGDARYTLGIIGVVPASKRLDRALDLLEALLEEDDRYCLRVKGKHPLDYGWLLKREDELAYYRNVFERINSNPRLRHKVIFDPPGDDVNDWFTMVGFILSPSDFESFHMAIGEGMLTGATPIIWDWDGAAEIWGEKWITRTLQDAKRVVVSGEPNKELATDIMSAMSSHDISQKWQNVIQKS